MLFKKNVHKKQTPGERSEPSDRESEAFFNCPEICPGTQARSIFQLPGNLPRDPVRDLFICPGICPGTPAWGIVDLSGNPDAGDFFISRKIRC